MVLGLPASKKVIPARMEEFSNVVTGFLVAAGPLEEVEEVVSSVVEEAGVSPFPSPQPTRDTSESAANAKTARFLFCMMDFSFP